MIFILIGISAPVVWIGLLLQYFVGFRWGLTPNAGYCDVFDPPEARRAADRPTGRTT